MTAANIPPQRAQRGIDNAALDQGIPDIAEALEKRNVGFVLRRFPDHSLLKFCEEVRPVLVVGDENPVHQSFRIRVPQNRH
jgi:hypothetical protein